MLSEGPCFPTPSPVLISDILIVFIWISLSTSGVNISSYLYWPPVSFRLLLLLLGSQSFSREFVYIPDINSLLVLDVANLFPYSATNLTFFYDALSWTKIFKFDVVKDIIFLLLVRDSRILSKRLPSILRTWRYFFTCLFINFVVLPFIFRSKPLGIDFLHGVKKSVLFFFIHWINFSQQHWLNNSFFPYWSMKTPQ